MVQVASHRDLGEGLEQVCRLFEPHRMAVLQGVVSDICCDHDFTDTLPANKHGIAGMVNEFGLDEGLDGRAVDAAFKIAETMAEIILAAPKAPSDEVLSECARGQIGTRLEFLFDIGDKPVNQLPAGQFCQFPRPSMARLTVL